MPSQRIYNKLETSNARCKHNQPAMRGCVRHKTPEHTQKSIMNNPAVQHYRNQSIFLYCLVLLQLLFLLNNTKLVHGSKEKGLGQHDIILATTSTGALTALHAHDGSMHWSTSNVLHTPYTNNNDNNINSNSDEVNNSKMRAMSGAQQGQVIISYDADVSIATSGEELFQKMPFVDKHGKFYVGQKSVHLLAIDLRTGNIVRSTDPQTQEDANNDDAGDNDDDIMWLGRADYSVTVLDAQSGAEELSFRTSTILPIDSDRIMAVAEGSMNANQEQEEVAVTSLVTDEQELLHQIWQQSSSAALVSSSSSMMPQLASQYSYGIGTSHPSNQNNYHPSYHIRMASNDGRRHIGFIDYNDHYYSNVKSNSNSNRAGKSAGSSKQPKDDVKLKWSTALEDPITYALHARTMQQIYVSLPQAGTENELSSQSDDDCDASSRIHIDNAAATENDNQHALELVAAHTTKHRSNLHQNVLLDESDLQFMQSQDLGVIMQYLEGMSRMRREQERNGFWNRFMLIMASWIPPAVALAFVISFEFGRRERIKANIRRQQQNSITIQPDDTTSSNKNPNNEMMDDNNTNSRIIEVSDTILGYGGHGTVVYRGTLSDRHVAVKRMLQTHHTNSNVNREISLLISSDGHENVVRYFLKEVRGAFVYLALELCDLSLADMIVALQKTGGGEKTNTVDAIMSTTTAQSSSSSSSAALRQHYSGVSNGIKEALRQIAHGVRHIHSLRIVHRDLKPQNILLARRRGHGSSSSSSNSARSSSTGVGVVDCKDYYGLRAALENQEFVLKISDMGLGKQLTGQQSSYGAARPHSTPFHSNSNNTINESSFTGIAAPGSIGWQAPEVLALRTCSSTASPNTNTNTSTTTTTTTFESNNNTNTNNNNNTNRRSVDIFSLGCIFHSVLVPGVHPYGEWYEREANIMRRSPTQLHQLLVPPITTSTTTEQQQQQQQCTTAAIADGHDLVQSMIRHDAHERPSARQICQHPLFWGQEVKISFLCELSDYLEAICETHSSSTTQTSTQSSAQSTQAAETAEALGILLQIETNADAIFNGSSMWDSKLHPALLRSNNNTNTNNNTTSSYRTYDSTSIRHCLRMLRNKYHHYEELSVEFRQSIFIGDNNNTTASNTTASNNNGASKNDLMGYFERMFPLLLMHCVGVCRANSDPRIKDVLLAQYGIASGARCCLSPVAESSSLSLLSSLNKQKQVVVVDDVKVAVKVAVKDDVNQEERSRNNAANCTNVVEQQQRQRGAPQSVLLLPSSSVSLLQHQQSSVVDAVTVLDPAAAASKDDNYDDNRQTAAGGEEINGTADNNNNNNNNNVRAANIDSNSNPAISPHQPIVAPTTTTTDIPDNPLLLAAAAANNNVNVNVIIWQNSDMSKAFTCRGWMHPAAQWQTTTSTSNNNRATLPDARYRTRLCNHWTMSQGTHCPMRQHTYSNSNSNSNKNNNKNTNKSSKKCIFAHGPVELRVKEGKRGRWGTLVDKRGGCANPNHSGGEDTYGAARSVECLRMEEGKWGGNNGGSRGGNGNGYRGRKKSAGAGGVARG